MLGASCEGLPWACAPCVLHAVPSWRDCTTLRNFILSRSPQAAKSAGGTCGAQARGRGDRWTQKRAHGSCCCSPPRELLPQDHFSLALPLFPLALGWYETKKVSPGEVPASWVLSIPGVFAGLHSFQLSGLNKLLQRADWERRVLSLQRTLCASDII